MNTIESMKARRSARLYEQKPVPLDMLMTLAELARLAPSGANRQPMRYIVVSDPEVAKKIHPHVAWAGYTAPLGAPKDDEMPPAYIALVTDTAVKRECAQDEGITGAAITYGAQAMGLSTCWLGAIGREPISRILRLPESWKLMSIIAVGYAKQTRVLETGEQPQYWVDEAGTLHVPKLPADKVVFENSWKA